MANAMRKYLNYIKGKGEGMIERGVPILCRGTTKNKHTKQEEILEQILAKERCSKIC